MNRGRKIVAVTALGIAALVVTTGWSVLAGETWPPQPYQEYSLAGSWTDMDGSGTVITMSPSDPRTGTGALIGTENKLDPTFGGMFPEATSWSPWFGTYVITGPNTSRTRLVCYVKQDGTPAPTILCVLVVDSTGTRTAPDLEEYEGTLSVYSPAADKDGDDQPDPGEAPVAVVPFTGGKWKRI